MRPVEYFSGKLDSVAQALPHCLRAVVSAANALQSSAATTLYHNITLMVPHEVSMLTKPMVTKDKILKAEGLPPSYSAQAAELVALTEACKLMKGKDATIYTDSQYAWATCHVFATYWQNRRMKTSTGKPVTHADLLKALITAVQLPRKLAICKCAAHTKGEDDITRGDAFADDTAKKAAQEQVQVLVTEVQDITTGLIKEMQQQSPQGEITLWKRKGATYKDEIYK